MDTKHEIEAVDGKDDIRRIDLKEFRELGYLQELNRQFLHPLGLALECTVEEDGTTKLSSVWDYRDDPDGMTYAEVDVEKASTIERLQFERMNPRHAKLGYWIQPRQPEEMPPVGGSS